MREMKHSGIEWIGEIPKDWEVHPVYAYFEEGKTKNYRMQEKNLLSLSYGRIIRKDINTNGGLLPASFNTYNVIEAGDIIIRPTDLQNDKRSLRTGLVKEQGIITSAYIDLRPKDNVNSKYYHYLLHSYDIIKVFYNMGNGVRQGLNFSEFAKLLLLDPSKVQQQQIADYLDTKCSEIDATAENIQKEISLLEEYKKSVITEAVTKGLNPDAEMKDSGIEWIGDINRKASLCRLKFFSYMKGRIGWQGLKSEDFIDNGPYCVTGTDFINGKINWDTCYHVSEERYKMDSNIQLKIGDLLVTKDGTIGKLAKVTELPEKACLNSHLLIIRPLNERFTNEYLYYVISSDVFVRYYKYSSTGSTMESLSQEKLGNFIFPVYDLLSQQQIVDYLDSKCSEIETLIADKKRQLDILADYKKSLIYEYVTGKKEVPVKDF